MSSLQLWDVMQLRIKRFTTGISSWIVWGVAMNCMFLNISYWSKIEQCGTRQRNGTTEICRTPMRGRMANFSGPASSQLYISGGGGFTGRKK